MKSAGLLLVRTGFASFWESWLKWGIINLLITTSLHVGTADGLLKVEEWIVSDEGSTYLYRLRLVHEIKSNFNTLTEF